MRETVFFILGIALLILPANAADQEPDAAPFQAPPGPPGLLTYLSEGDQAESQKDPGYSLYKEAYKQILNGEWEAARKKLAEFSKKYPQSDYRDDAQYWSSYALMQLDRKKAVDAYEEFVKNYKESKYYDDAVADLAELKAQIEMKEQMAATARWNARIRVYDKTLKNGVAPQIWIEDTAGKNGKEFRVTSGIAPNVQKLQRVLERQSRMYSRLGIPRTLGPLYMAKSETLDKETALKMEALYALGETQEDERSYTTLKEVALDPTQPRPLREAAMEALSVFTKHDVLPVFVEIARKDTDAQLQSIAVDYIGEHGKDKNSTVTVLIDLFNTLPGPRTGQRETIFYTIADVGNDKAVDFLKSVALTHDNYDLRRDAVFYLGSIGGEKARDALYEVLRGK